jgi:hypothetical protein
MFGTAVRSSQFQTVLIMHKGHNVCCCGLRHFLGCMCAEQGEAESVVVCGIAETLRTQEQCLGYSAHSKGLRSALGQGPGDWQEAVPVSVGLEDGDKPFHRAYAFVITLNAIQMDVGAAKACTESVHGGHCMK